jgi:hypothetical protein
VRRKNSDAQRSVSAALSDVSLDLYPKEVLP